MPSGDRIWRASRAIEVRQSTSVPKTSKRSALTCCMLGRFDGGIAGCMPRLYGFDARRLAHLVRSLRASVKCADRVRLELAPGNYSRLCERLRFYFLCGAHIQ